MGTYQIESQEKGVELKVEDGRIGGINYQYFPIYEKNLETLCKIASYWNGANNQKTSSELNKTLKESETKEAIEDASNSINSIAVEKKFQRCVYISCKIVSGIYKMAKHSDGTGENKKQDSESDFKKYAENTWPAKAFKKLKELKVPDGFLKEMDMDDLEGSKSRSSYDPEEDKGKLVEDARSKMNQTEIPRILDYWESIDGYGTSKATTDIAHLGIQEICFEDIKDKLPEILQNMMKYSKKADTSFGLVHQMRHRRVRDCIIAAEDKLVNSFNMVSQIDDMYKKYDKDTSTSKIDSTQCWPGIDVDEKKAVASFLSDETFDHTHDAMWEVVTYCKEILNNISSAAELYGSKKDALKNLAAASENIKKANTESSKSKRIDLDVDIDIINKNMITDDEAAGAVADDKKGSKKTKDLKEKLLQINKKAKNVKKETSLGKVNDKLFEKNLNAEARELVRACIVLLQINHKPIINKTKKVKKKEEEKPEKEKTKIKPTGANMNDEDDEDDDIFFERNFTFAPTSDRDVIFVPDFIGYMLYTPKFNMPELDEGDYNFQRIPKFNMPELDEGDYNFQRVPKFNMPELDEGDYNFQRIPKFNMPELDEGDYNFQRVPKFNMPKKNDDLIGKLKQIKKIKPRSHLDMFDTWSILRALLTTAGTLAKDMDNDIQESDVFNGHSNLETKLHILSEKMLKDWIKKGNREMLQLVSHADKYDEKFEMDLKKLTAKQYKSLKWNLYILIDIFFNLSHKLHIEAMKHNFSDSDYDSDNWNSDYDSDNSYFNMDDDMDDYDLDMMEEKANEFIIELKYIKLKLERREPLLAGKKNARIRKALKENPSDIINAYKMPAGNIGILRVIFSYLLQTNHINNVKDVFSGKKYASQKSATVATFWKN